MGADIHMVGQVRVNGKWESVAPNLDDSSGFYRNYGAFGRMAGVRNSFEPQICEARGLPADFEIPMLPADEWNKEPRPKYMGDHTYSWFTCQELLVYLFKERNKGELGKCPTCGRGEDWEHDGDGTDYGIEWLTKLAAELSYLDPNPSEVRVVFGFDS